MTLRPTFPPTSRPVPLRAAPRIRTPRVGLTASRLLALRAVAGLGLGIALVWALIPVEGGSIAARATLVALFAALAVLAFTVDARPSQDRP